MKTIPLLEWRGGDPRYLIEQAPEQFASLLAHGRRSHGRAVLRVGDAVARRWLIKANNPFLHEIEQVAACAKQPGAVMLNLSYEFSCSTGVAADPEGAGNRLLRTLDWPLRGLGENVVVARCAAPAGSYYSVTWPGAVGVLTAMAPGRFSAAINQPPIDSVVGACWADWLLTRPAVWRSTALPAAHLLRQVFDECVTYEAARQRLVETPIAVPAFFALSGVSADEGCIIERTQTQGAVHEAPACITNHWLKTKRRGHARGIDSSRRLEQIRTFFESTASDFRWLTPPVLNETTRLAVIANAATEKLLVQGWEREGPATAPFNLQAYRDADTVPPQ